MFRLEYALMAHGCFFFLYICLFYAELLSLKMALGEKDVVTKLWGDG